LFGSFAQSGQMSRFSWVTLSVTINTLSPRRAAQTAHRSGSAEAIEADPRTKMRTKLHYPDINGRRPGIGVWQLF
jgi:hypothetical protein